jgi:hypothetical protein
MNILLGDQMTIIRQDQTGTIELTPIPFESEAKLEDVLFSNPNLLCTSGDSRLAVLKRQVDLPRAGLLDLLMVNSDGIPVAVEVKLGRNRQSRREVVGQIVDYVSILTSFTVDEMDCNLDGGLEAALRLFDGDEKAFETRWQAVGRNLRSGYARYVIAIDEVPEDLERIVRFLKMRSNLDLRLTKIEKYQDTNGQTIYVPTNVVDEEGVVDIDKYKSPKEISQEFQAVLDAYNEIANPEFPITGKAARYRQIIPANWRAAIHYEFMKHKSGIGVELHVESKSMSYLAPTLKAFAGEARPAFSYPIIWNPDWASGRLWSEFSDDQPPEIPAEAMCKFIDLTYDAVAAALAQKAVE